MTLCPELIESRASQTSNERDKTALRLLGSFLELTRNQLHPDLRSSIKSSRVALVEAVWAQAHDAGARSVLMRKRFLDIPDMRRQAWERLRHLDFATELGLESDTDDFFLISSIDLLLRGVEILQPDDNDGNRETPFENTSTSGIAA